MYKICASLSEKKEIMVRVLSQNCLSCLSRAFPLPSEPLFYMIFDCRDVFEWTRMTKGDEILGKNERDKSYRHSDVF